ncbi:MAG: radical SAM protein [Desulfobacterales bacterium]
MELSRGCWWQGVRGVGGCAFCNLNQQWRGYRSKSVPRAVAEIDALTRNYKTLSVALMDNVLPRETSAQTFRELAGLGKDLNLFGEIRATTSRQQLEKMHAAGLRRVQIGIEALSTRLLRKMRKGTRAIQNLEIMKHCERLGVTNLANLIAHFPGSDEEDVRETLHTLEFALPFYPPTWVEFWLGLGSPVWRRPGDYDLRSVAPHPHWRQLFPASVARGFPFVVQSGRGGAGRQRRLWRPARAALRAWSKRYERLHQGPFRDPILGYRDGGDFMIIRERRLGGEVATHRLEGVSRKIYLFCETHRPLKLITERFPEAPVDRIEEFLARLTDQRLVFEESGCYLSLAVPEQRR